ncbi:MAG: dihydropteroate synthase [Desulfosarcinaceae bacterium]
METRVSSQKNEVIISGRGATVMIGERINPTGKKKMAEALKNHQWEVIRDEALAQVAAGAGILDVNVAAPGLDETYLLPKAIETIMAAVDVPLCIDINNAAALAEALKVCEGKPIVNSVSGEEKSLNEVLPLVKSHGAAVIALTLDDDGIPKEAGKRVAIAHKIVEHAAALGIPAEDIIVDCLTLALGPDDKAGQVTLQAIRKVKAELGVNQTLGASNISFGLPDRQLINQTFLSLAIEAGVTCPTVDAQRVGPTVLATDLLLGRDRFCQRFIKDFRKRQ